MQINKTSVLDKFNTFLDSISHNVISSDIFASFAFEITENQIISILSNNSIFSKDFFYWKMEDENVEFLAIDPLSSFKTFGEARLAKTCKEVNSIEKKFISNWEDLNVPTIPFVVGGIKFAPNQKSKLWTDFSDSDWFIPKTLFLNLNGKSYLVHNFIFNSDKTKKIAEFEERLKLLESLPQLYNESILENRLVNPISSNSKDRWRSIVNKAMKHISEGLLSKVVLSREVMFEIEQEPIITQLIEKLSLKYPKCYTFAYSRNNSIFIGASPEKLAKISNNWIEVDALAGSAPRGKDNVEDIDMENFLLNSEKNLFEQRAVVNFIHNLLSKFSDEIIFDDKPIIRKLPNIQHLWTIIRARLNNNFKIFEILMKIHPTPAICGDPWKVAKDFILENEPHDRGFYSGNIGWFNFNGEGEFAVGIRSALIKNKKIFVYAGCGIVEGSEADAEFEESEIKLKPILSLFVDEKIYQP